MVYKIEPPVDFITVNEGARIYQYDSYSLQYNDVKEVCVRPSGSHRLNLGDGTKVIVLPGWIALEIHGIDEWVF